MESCLSTKASAKMGDLRFVIWDFRFVICDLRFEIWDLLKTWNRRFLDKLMRERTCFSVPSAAGGSVSKRVACPRKRGHEIRAASRRRARIYQPRPKGGKQKTTEIDKGYGCLWWANGQIKTAGETRPPQLFQIHLPNLFKILPYPDYILKKLT